MYFQKNMKRILIIVMCLILVTGHFVTSPVTVRAATSDEITLTDDGILKYVLAKMGVFLNDSLLSKFGDSLGNVLYNDLCELTPAFKEWSDNWLTLNTDLEGKFKSTSAMLGYILKHNAFTTPIEVIDDMLKVKKTDKLTLPKTITNKIKDRLDAFLENETGYLLLKTLTTTNIDPTAFANKAAYDAFSGSIKKSLESVEFLGLYTKYIDFREYYAFTPDGRYCAFSSLTSSVASLYDKDWNKFSLCYGSGSFNDAFSSSVMYDIPSYPEKPISNVSGFVPLKMTWKEGIYSIDGRPLKIFKSLDTMKAYSVGYQPYYCTADYGLYNPDKDNTLEFTGANYNNSVNTNYYQNIQETVSNQYNTNNSITEGDVTNIVNNYYQTTIIQGGGSGGDSGGGDSGGSGGDSGGGDSGGGGIGAIIEGIGKLLNAIATIIGKVVGLISDFLVTVLNILGSFTGVTDGFATILKSIFSFMPPEFIDTMVLGLTISILLCIIKFLKG